MRRKVDRLLFFITLALVAAGLLAISSASVAVSQRNFGTLYYYFFHQGFAALVGLGAMFVLQYVPYKFWKKVSLPLLFIAVLMAAAVFMPKLGLEFGGATRWLKLGPVNLQPSEILKISLILYLASWLEKKRGHVSGLTTAFVPFLVVISVLGVILVLQKDVGTLAIIGGSAVFLYFIGGGKSSQVAAIIVLAAAGLFALTVVAPYRLNRLTVFLNPGADPQGTGYHISQALIAIGTGGFWGRGYGQSIQKYNYLPEPINDSIFAIIVEEFGFFGASVLIALFLAFFWRAFGVVKRAPDLFAKLLVSGFTLIIILQAAINMSAISGIMPLTGVPLPFISYGGTSLVITLAMVGVMLNVSKHT